MVFYHLGAGLICGLTLPFMVKDLVYMTLSNAFLRPHLKFRIERERMHKDQAVSTRMLDSYLKDIFGSFLIFWAAIGPVIYEAHFKKSEMSQQEK